nr:MAG TPA: tail protein [Bacteriophage sp.]
MGFVTKNNNSAVAQNEPRLNAVKFEQSTFGAAKTVVYGTNRITGNVIDNVDFTTISHTETQRVGKGGSQKQSSTSYTYKSRVVIGLCCGEIQGVKKIIVDDGIHSLSDYNFNLFRGTNSQEAWGEMLSRHPERALKYRNLAYVAGYIDLTNSGGIPQFHFEVNGKFTANKDDLTPVITEGFSFSTDSGTLGNCSAALEYAGYYVSDKEVEVVYYTSNGEERTLENFRNYSKNGNNYTFYLGGLGAVSAHVYLTYNSKVRLDANPKDIVFDILTNKIYGAGFPEEYIADLSNFSDFCIANNVFLSPVYDSQSEAQEELSDIAEISNAAFVWTQGKLHLLPLGDETVSDNGKTWTPDLTPIYDLNADDFLGDDDEPIVCSRKQQSEVFNQVKIEFLNRANDYNIEVAEAQDLADIELHGARPADTMEAHQICTAEIAQRTAQLALERNLAVRNQYSFKLPMKYILLDPLDIVTLTHSRLGLYREPVRILSIEENEGELEITAEELVIGTATPARIQHQRSSTEKIDFAQPVGNVNPVVVFEPPFQLTQETLEVWVGGSSNDNLFGGAEIWISDDGTTYRQAGTITTQVRQGILSKPLAVFDGDIDEADVLHVDLSMSKSELLSGTAEDARKLNTLCYVDGEFVAYKDALLVDDYEYELSYLKRGAYSSGVSAHDAGKQFCRVDEGNFLKIPFTKDDIGKEIAVKALTFNVFGAGLQTLADVQPFYYKIKGTALQQAPENVQGLTSYYSNGFSILTWQPVDDTRNIVYEIRKGDSWHKGQCLGRIAANQFSAKGNGTYFVKAYVPDYGVYSEKAAIIEIDGARLVQNVIAIHNERAEGWKGKRSPGVIINDYKMLALAGSGLFSKIPKFSEIENLLYLGGVSTEGTYEADNIVDIGAAASCYVSVDYKFVGENPFELFSKIPKFSEISSLLGNYGGEILNSRIQIAIAGDDDEFGEWQDFITGQYFGKKFKFRAVLASNSDRVVAKMEEFTIYVDVPDIVETGTEIVIPVEGKKIEFSKNFHIVPNVQVTILNKNRHDDETVIVNDEKSFDIIIHNDGHAVEKTINFVAQGY